MITLKKTFFGLAAACLLLFTACSDSFNNNNPNNVIDGTAMTLSLFVDGLGVESATRMTVGSEDHEEDVNTLHLFFFEQSSDRSGQFVDMVLLENPALGAPNLIPTSDNKLSASEAYVVIGVANADGYMEAGWENNWDEKHESDFRNSVVAALPKTIESPNLLMNGVASKQAGNGLITMKLTRNVARFDVENRVTDYDLVSAELRNIYNASSITGDMTMNYAADNTEARSGTSGTIELSVIKGKIYGFENRSSDPAMGDAVTTCLIVCLQEKDGVPAYYRININPQDEPQSLRRNNVYSIAVTDVNGEGYPTAEEAYEGTKEDELDYAINNWDLGDNGVIVSDSYSILALPTKVAQIGKDGTSTAGTGYIVTTFSSLESPTPLAIKSKTLDAGLDVKLEGNTLFVTAAPLDGTVEERNGTVTLTYAGLEVTMDILQSLQIDAFLRISYEEGWNGLFPASGGVVSKSIFVNSSGPWTATIIGDEGFSFSPDADVTEISSDNINGSFKIATRTDNPNETKRRNMFVIVSLDSDPLNRVCIVNAAQAAASVITISPVVETVSFNGSKSNLESDANTYSFTVQGAVAEDDDDDDDTPSQAALTATITEGAPRFACSFDQTTGTLKIWTTATNSSSANIEGKLVIDADGSEMILNLIQRPLSLSVVAQQPTVVSAAGATTGQFNLVIDDEDAKWTAKFEVKTTGGEIFNHIVKLVYADGEKEGQPVGETDQLTSSTPMKIVFPKIYFPNREIDIRATVTLTTLEGASASYTFTQEKLASKGVSIWNTGGGWGTLGDGVIAGYTQRLRALGYSYGGSYSAQNTTYVHFGNGTISNINYNWSTIESFRTGKDGVTMFVCDNNGTSHVNTLNSATSPLRISGYTVSGATGSAGNTLPVASNISSTRIGLFLTTKGKTPVEPGNISRFYRDGIATELSSYPATAVPIIESSSGGGRYFLAIDPVNKIIFLGDGQAFQSTGNLSGNRGTLMNNLIEYVAYAAKYGSHFTEMLRDDLEDLKPFWDEVWGDNRWPVRNN